MANRRKLIDYLPPYMQKYAEIKAIMDADQLEVDKIWDAADQTMNDQFILDSTEYGVGRWEKMLKISPKPTDTLDERKFRILTVLNRELPYTYRMLERMLTNLCGNDGFTIILRPNEYYISIRLALANESYYTDVKNMLERILPANMTSVVEIKYNTHKNLSRYTHRQLQAYSHEQLRKEVFKDGQQNT